jgi:hypothetical protein
MLTFLFWENALLRLYHTPITDHNNFWYPSCLGCCCFICIYAGDTALLLTLYSVHCIIQVSCECKQKLNFRNLNLCIYTSHLSCCHCKLKLVSHIHRICICLLGEKYQNSVINSWIHKFHCVFIGQLSKWKVSLFS